MGKENMMKALGDKLRGRAKRLKLGQREVAKLSGCSHTTINDMLKGEIVKLETLNNVAKVLKLEISIEIKEIKEI